MKKGMGYFDFKRHWTKRVVPHLNDLEFNRVLVDDFDKYAFGHALPGSTSSARRSAGFIGRCSTCNFRLWMLIPRNVSGWHFTKELCCQSGST